MTGLFNGGSIILNPDMPITPALAATIMEKASEAAGRVIGQVLQDQAVSPRHKLAPRMVAVSALQSVVYTLSRLNVPPEEIINLIRMAADITVEGLEEAVAAAQAPAKEELN